MVIVKLHFFVLLGHNKYCMTNIPILKINQFKQDKELTEFYSNELSNHFSKNKALIKKAHKHNFYLCILFLEGNGIHEIDFNSYTIKPGSVFFFKTWSNSCFEVYKRT